MSRIEEKIEKYIEDKQIITEDAEKDYEYIKNYSFDLASKILSLDGRKVYKEDNYFLEDEEQNNKKSSKNKKGKRQFKFSIRTFDEKIWKYRNDDDDDWPDFIGEKLIDKIIKEKKVFYEKIIIKGKIKTEVFPEEKSYIYFTVTY